LLRKKTDVTNKNICNNLISLKLKDMFGDYDDFEMAQVKEKKVNDFLLNFLVTTSTVFLCNMKGFPS